MEHLSDGLGWVIDKLWPNYESAVAKAGLRIESNGTELVLGGWSPQNGRMIATAYAKTDRQRPTISQPISGQLASPGEHVREVAPSMAQADLVVAARLWRPTSMSRWAAPLLAGTCW